MPQSHGSTLNSLQRHWNDKAQMQTDDLAKVDTSARSQWYRFEMFARYHEIVGASVLDVGCGVGDFYSYLRSVAPSTAYTGVDLSAVMVERCKQRFPNAKFEACDLLTWPADRRWDYVTAFAVHNIRVPGAKELLHDLTARQFELCNQATHLSLLTDRFSGFGNDILPWDPAEVLRMALQITPWVVLRHNYLPHDFSITLYRSPLSDRDPVKMPGKGGKT